VEAKRANARQQYGNSRRYYYKRCWPDGNFGPGLVSLIVEWKPRVRIAVFKWTAEKDWWRGENARNTKPKSITVPAAELFNVTAYQPGDYKRFFADPRTRSNYLEWAPLMLAAEDYHAGKIALGKPSRKQHSA